MRGVNFIQIANFIILLIKDTKCSFHSKLPTLPSLGGFLTNTFKEKIISLLPNAKSKPSKTSKITNFNSKSNKIKAKAESGLRKRKPKRKIKKFPKSILKKPHMKAEKILLPSPTKIKSNSLLHTPRISSKMKKSVHLKFSSGKLPKRKDHQGLRKIGDPLRFRIDLLLPAIFIISIG